MRLHKSRHPLVVVLSNRIWYLCQYAQRDSVELLHLIKKIVEY